MKSSIHDVNHPALSDDVKSDLLEIVPKYTCHYFCICLLDDDIVCELRHVTLYF